MTRRFTSRNFINTDGDLADTLQRYLDIHTDALEAVTLAKHCRMSAPAKASLNALLAKVTVAGARSAVLVKHFISKARQATTPHKDTK